MKKHGIFSSKKIARPVALIISVALILGCSMLSASALGETEPSDWQMNRACTAAATDAGVQLSIGTTGAFLAGATYKTALDMSEDVSFSFTIDEWEPFGGLFRFAISNEPESVGYNNKYGEGIFVGGYFFSGAINAFDGGWKVMYVGDMNTVTVKRGVTGWETYLANSGNAASDNVAFMGTVSYDTIPEDYFTNNCGYLNLYVMHSTDDVTYYPAKITINEVIGTKVDKSSAYCSNSWQSNRQCTVKPLTNGSKFVIPATDSAFLAGATLKNPLDMSGDVSFSFTIDKWEPFGGQFCFSLSDTPESVGYTNQYQKGVYVGGYFFNGAINAFDGGWKVMHIGDVNTVTIKRGATGWETYLANSGNAASDNVAFMGTISYDTVPADYFTNNRAYLNVYFMHAVDNVYYPVECSVTAVDGAFVVGDLNGDNKINAEDLPISRRILLGASDSINAADVNGDGQCNAKDLVALKKLVA